MFKRIAAVCVIIVLAALACCAVPALAAEPEACLSTQRFCVNGAEVVCEKYNIDGSNYFKLRDLAYLLRDTDSRFSVVYDEAMKEIQLVPGGDYEPLGTELDVSRGDFSAAAQTGTQPLRVNGEAVDCEAYYFEGYNFYKLRDLAKYLGFRVDWDPDRNAAVVESGEYVQGAGRGTLLLNGTVYDRSSTWVELGEVSPALAGSVAAALRELPALKTVNLMRVDGTTRWDVMSAKRLHDAVPEANLRYAFELFGKWLSVTDTEEVCFDGVYIGDEGLPQISAAIDVLRACKRIVLDDCGTTNEAMAALRDAHPETKVVWRVHLGYANMLTDETMIRLTSRVNDTNSWVLHYCTDVVYLDLGHNSASEAKEGGMRDLSFMAYMPNLEAVILSAAPCSDLSPLANCKKLVWLELSNCYYLTDISVLADHPTLRYLNISHTSINDISMLDNVKLERFHSMENAVPYDQKVHFIEAHPDCLWVFNDRRLGDYNADNWDYGYGWRYDSYLNVGSSQFWYYRELRDIFHYDQIHWWNHKGA